MTFVGVLDWHSLAEGLVSAKEREREGQRDYRKGRQGRGYPCYCGAHMGSSRGSRWDRPKECSPQIRGTVRKEGRVSDAKAQDSGIACIPDGRGHQSEERVTASLLRIARKQSQDRGSG